MSGICEENHASGWIGVGRRRRAGPGTSSGPAIAQQGNEIFVPVPDGMEFSGTNQIGLSQVANAAAGTVWASIIGFEY